MLEGLLCWLNAGPLQEVGVTGGTLAGKQPQNSLRGNSVPHIGGVVPILLIPPGSTCTFTPSQRSRAPRRGRHTLVLGKAQGFGCHQKREINEWETNTFCSFPTALQFSLNHILRSFNLMMILTVER